MDGVISGKSEIKIYGGTTPHFIQQLLFFQEKSMILDEGVKNVEGLRSQRCWRTLAQEKVPFRYESEGTELVNSNALLSHYSHISFRKSFITL
jgi:hypothetical protein